MELVELCVIHVAEVVSAELVSHAVPADHPAALVCSFHVRAPPVIVPPVNQKNVNVSRQNQDHLARLPLVVYVVVHVILVGVVHVVRVVHVLQM